MHVRMLSRYTRLFIPLVLIMLLFSLAIPISLNGLYDIQSNVHFVPNHWENDLYEVISYVNQKLPDNFSIVTCYALPISYFTNHPVIEVVTTYGIMNLLTLPADDMEGIINSLIEHNIRYLLLPKSGHSHFGYFKNLSRSIPVLSDTFIDSTPYIILLKDFSKFRLFKLITKEEALQIYSYLTFYEDGWIPLNNNSLLMSSNTMGILHASEYVSLTIADDYQDLFWQSAMENTEDKIFLSNDIETKVSGSNSLKIDVNGTGHILIKHKYETPQDWSSFNFLNFYLYGANSSNNIVVTFHTSIWQDYNYINVEDDFIGWKKLSIPLDTFLMKGEASWSSIQYIEVLLGRRIATYYMDKIRLEGYAIGVEGSLPPITTNSSEVNMVLSIRDSSLQTPALLKLNSYNTKEELIWTLTNGFNHFKIPSELLREGATLKLFYYQKNSAEELRLNFLGILFDSSQ